MHTSKNNMDPRPSSSPLVPVAQQDFLEQDMDIRGQKYVCLSFISPEDVITDKAAFLQHKFLGDVTRDINELFEGLAQKFANIPEVPHMIRSLKERYSYLTADDALQSQFQAFCAAHPELEEEYHDTHGFQTSVRGIKVRGSYETFQEAQHRVQAIQRFDKKFDVYIAQVGCWCPWAPRPEQLEDQVYAETQLNSLMKGYTENAARRDELHLLRKKEFAESSASAVPAPAPDPAPAPAPDPDLAQALVVDVDGLSLQDP